MTNPIFLGIISLLSLAIVWKGSTTLEQTSENLALYYRLPPIVQGAIIAAIGSSFPELSSTVISSLLHGEFELGVSVIAGSAIFNILVIPGLSGLVSRHSLSTNRDIVFKEALFYLLSAATVLLVFALAAIYHPVGRLSSTGTWVAAAGSSASEAAATAKATMHEEGLFTTVTRSLMIIPLLLYVLYVFLQYHDTRDHQAKEPPDHIKPAREWGALALSLVAILLGVEGLVRSAIGFGEVFNTPSSLWGVTVIAIATSISDTFISVKAAGEQKSVVSLSNVLGSNTFDLLVAIPAGVLIAGSAVVNFSLAAPLFAFVIGASILLFIFIRTDLSLNKAESILLLAVYGVFVLWMVAESFDVLDLIPI